MADEREIVGITVKYSGGEVLELKKGCCVNLEECGDSMTVEMLNASPADIARLTYGLIVCCTKMGLEEDVKKIAGGVEHECEDYTEESD